MSETISQKSENTYTRRAFIQTMLAAPLVLGAAALLPEEAEAAGGVIKMDYIRLHVPTIWKKRVKWHEAGYANSRLHGELRYHASGSKKTSVVIASCKFSWRSTAGVPTHVKPSGKLKIKYSGFGWNVSRGPRLRFSMRNIPLLVWDSKHGNSSVSLTKTQAKELLKIATGGRIKYDTLIKWSRDKAKDKGAKAQRAWIGSKVIKKIEFV